MYGLDYVKASDKVELKGGLATFYDAGEQPKILEVFTPKAINDEILLNYFKNLK